jgi:hypothetical protein
LEVERLVKTYCAGCCAIATCNDNNIQVAITKVLKSVLVLVLIGKSTEGYAVKCQAKLIDGIVDLNSFVIRNPINHFGVIKRVHMILSKNPVSN